MKKFLLSVMLVASAMTMVVAEAEARRLGSGGSVGRQSSAVSRQAPMQRSQTPPAGQQAQQQQQKAGQAQTPPAAQPKQPSRWGGILGGALLGLGLGALLSSMGIGGAAASLISTILMVALIGGVIMLIFRMMRKKPEQGHDRTAYAGGYGSPASFDTSRTPEIGSGLPSQNQPAAFQAEQPAASADPAAYAPWGVPADFDVPAFLRSAKAYFIRLQAAWDRADVNDLREFTTPEMFAELRLQIQERGSAQNVTDVVALDADLMGIETIGDEYLASVKFNGQIKESAHGPTEAFSEVWNLSRPVSGKSGWVLAGIQQIN